MTDDELMIDDRDWLNERIEAALRHFESGQFYTAEESRLDMERRKAEWLAARNQPDVSTS